MIDPSNALIVSQMFQAYNGETPNTKIKNRINTIPDSCNNRFKCEHTFIDDVAVLQLREIAMAYRPELVATVVVRPRLPRNVSKHI